MCVCVFTLCLRTVEAAMNMVVNCDAQHAHTNTRTDRQTDRGDRDRERWQDQLL